MDLKNISKGGKVLQILRMGNPLLTQISAEVDAESKETMNIIQDMVATILDIGEIAGMAAPQISYLKKIIYYQVPKTRGDKYNPDGVAPKFLINPSYSAVADDKISGWEACLSTPGIAAEVERFLSIRIKATGWDGASFCDVDKVVHGYEARVLQHEIDHLEGKLYILKRRTPASLSYIEEAQNFHIKR